MERHLHGIIRNISRKAQQLNFEISGKIVIILENFKLTF